MNVIILIKIIENLIQNLISSFLTNHIKLYTYSVLPKRLKKMLIEYGLIGYKNKYIKNFKN